MKRITGLLICALLLAPAALYAGFHTGMVKAVKSKVMAIDVKVTEYKAAEAARSTVLSAFDFSPVSPTVGQAVTFADASSGNPASWAWTFGDGASSVLRNPTHSYSAAGTYTVTLTAANTAGSSFISHSVAVAAAAVAPAAAFGFSPSLPSSGQAVTFTDATTNTPTSWAWTFGDGGTSTAQHPAHTYSSAGTYTVTLTVANTVGSSSVSHAITVAASGVFTLASSALVNGGALPVTYACDGDSISMPLAWSNAPAGVQEFALMIKTIPVDGSPKWNWVLHSIPGAVSGLAANTSGIGVNGVGSDLPGQVYNPPCPQGPGAKTYTLTVYALSASPVLPLPGLVTGDVLTSAISAITISSASLSMTYARPAPTASFTFSPASPVSGQTVTFTDTSTCTPTGWYWNFGDGSSSTEQNTTHAYGSAGTYTASLTASNPYGVSSSSRTITVSGTGTAPAAAFSVYPSTPSTYNTVSFTDASSNSPTSWSWSFGDGATSTAEYPTHAYAAAGTYTVTLTASNSGGSSTLTRSVKVEVPAYNISQGLSEQAQSTTLAFDALGLMHANLGAQSFFPPGKVADYTGFQFLRDSDPSELGHNPVFTGLASNSVIRILTDSQLAQLAALAASQKDLVNEYGYHRFRLIKAFRRLMDGDIPAGSSGLSMSAVTAVSQELYLMDGQIAFDRAMLYANIYNSMTLAQKAQLNAMKGVGASSWTVTDNNVMMSRIQAALGANSQDRTMNTLVMTYAGDLFSWYSGTVEADVYFCPERHGTYYGGFYLKDAPAMNAPQGVSYTIDSALTGNAGAALLQPSLGYVTSTQAAIMANLTTLQESNMDGIVAVRTQIAALLRTLIDSPASADAVRTQVLALSSSTYGTLDGRNNYYYATAFKQVYDSLSTAQRAHLKTDFWDGLLISTYSNGTPFNYAVSQSTFLYSDAVTDAGVMAQIAPYLADTDFLFATDPVSAEFSFAPSLPSVGQSITFTDASSGPPASWAWDFGDGGTSTSQNPTHGYASSGTYTVSLTATNSVGSSSISHSVTVSQGSFTLASGAGASGGAMTLEYSCSGAGSSPAMSWTNAPSGTQQFALTISELTPQLETKYNWVLYGIPSGSSGFAKNTTGGGTVGLSDGPAGTAYNPPCGGGNRLYTYRLYALSGAPSIPADPAQVTGSVLTTALSGITISSATMTMTYTAP